MTANSGQRKESFFVKIFIAVFFLLGIGLWFGINTPDERKKVEIDITLDQKVMDILFDAGVRQEDIVKQYAKDTGDTNATWTQYYKTIKASEGRVQTIEESFRAIARQMNLGLEKIVNVDGTTTYNFLDSKKRQYSNITFIIEPENLSGAKTKSAVKKTSAKTTLQKAPVKKSQNSNSKTQSSRKSAARNRNVKGK